MLSAGSLNGSPRLALIFTTISSGLFGLQRIVSKIMQKSSLSMTIIRQGRPRRSYDLVRSALLEHFRVKLGPHAGYVSHDASPDLYACTYLVILTTGMTAIGDDPSTE